MLMIAKGEGWLPYEHKPGPSAEQRPTKGLYKVNYVFPLDWTLSPKRDVELLSPKSRSILRDFKIHSGLSSPGNSIQLRSVGSFGSVMAAVLKTKKVVAVKDGKEVEVDGLEARTLASMNTRNNAVAQIKYEDGQVETVSGWVAAGRKQSKTKMANSQIENPEEKKQQTKTVCTICGYV